MSVKVYTDGYIDRLLDDLPFAPDVVVDGVEEGEGVDRLQWALLPLRASGSILSVIRLTVESDTDMP